MLWSYAYQTLKAVPKPQVKPGDIQTLVKTHHILLVHPPLGKRHLGPLLRIFVLKYCQKSDLALWHYL
jgi:hypothetical protein